METVEIYGGNVSKENFIIGQYSPEPTLAFGENSETKKKASPKAENFVSAAKDKPAILVIDDDPAIRNVFERALATFGYPVVVVESGERAIEAIKKSAFEIAFIDVVMPGINGLETYKAISKIMPDIKVVMMSGYAVDDLIQQAINEGAKSFLKKPFELGELLKTIKNLEV
ncbi:MAG: response regulator [Deltaproteobacteria bacterium]|nr:response regulator [Deltaproteobacteria bacterium]